jgi:hypothetical protein
VKSCGIITMHRPRNVGSALQAYALQYTIERLGYRCEIIDYVYPNAFHRQTSAKSQVLKSVNARLKKWLGRGQFELSERRFDEFLSKRLHLTSSYPTSESLQENPPIYDVYMVGSDQVWRSDYIRGDPSFFCGFAPAGKPIVSYGSSFGVARIDAPYRDAYREHLQRFSHISVRERDAVDLVETLSGRQATMVLDPTLLLDEAEWGSHMPEVKTEPPYILCYGNVHAEKYARELALHVQARTGYPIVWLFGRPWDRFGANCQHVFDVGPLEFLVWVRNAALVLTQSFHGTIFAVNFGRPFYSMHQTAQTGNTRQMSMLRCLNCEDRGLEIGQPFPTQGLFDIDFNVVHDRLSALRTESLSYLKNALAG